ncbi:acyl-CoA-binding domain-containing protein 5-like [Phragmites australis]|uniref:acyl-CoA-binding domain-containing protein 5-like n=1 Tax=Phragmites australis TaxID=29695 RepID=UPI002D795970|nr:acyl-CoA-binding domain-containing protein 5-like [Phragmites australis]
MELFYELLLTAAVTLLAAFLLATLVTANDPPRRESGTDRAAATITEEAVEEEEEERIVEVDEVTHSEGRAAPAEAEGWAEVEKALAVVVEEEEPECLVEEEEVRFKAALGARVGAGVEEEQEEVHVGEKRRGLTAAAAATGVVIEANPHVLGTEVVPREILDLVGLERGRVQDVGVKQHDLGADVAPSEVIDARSEKRGIQVVEVAEVLPLKTEAVEVKQHHLVAEVAPAAEVLDAGLKEEKSVQVIDVRPDELTAEAAPEEILDVILEKKEEQIVEVKERELAVEAAPQPVLNVPLAEKEKLRDQEPIEEEADENEEVMSKEEAKCEAHPVDQQEELVPEQELVARKTDDVEVSHEGSSSDKVVTELPVEVVTLQGLPEDDAEADMDFGEWEGIERSEVEKRFGAAAAFAASEAGATALSKLDSDVQLQLQGLLKVAIDGPCYDSTQPLTLRPSSRAKWVAWQKLGNMHPEIAMEKYMNLLSETIPEWMGNKTSDTKKHEAGGSSGRPILTMAAASDQQINQGNEDSTSIDEGRLTTSPNSEKGQSSDIPAE